MTWPYNTNKSHNKIIYNKAVELSWILRIVGRNWWGPPSFEVTAEMKTGETLCDPGVKRWIYIFYGILRRSDRWTLNHSKKKKKRRKNHCKIGLFHWSYALFHIKVRSINNKIKCGAYTAVAVALHKVTSLSSRLLTLVIIISMLLNTIECDEKSQKSQIMLPWNNFKSNIDTKDFNYFKNDFIGYKNVLKTIYRINL